MSKILLTAGYNKSRHSIIIAEQLRQLGTPPSMIMIAYPMTFGRIKYILKNRGLKAISKYILPQKSSITKQSPLDNYWQQKDIEHNSLRSWAKKWNVPCHSVGNINGKSAAKKIATFAPDCVTYTGGGILKNTFLEAANCNILNAHSGPLPAIRGMNACEWSLLLNQPLSVTIHLIDKGIDTGKIVKQISVTPHKDDTIEMLRERCVINGIEAMVYYTHKSTSEQLSTYENTNAALHRQCFVLSTAMRELLTVQLPYLIDQQVKS